MTLFFGCRVAPSRSLAAIALFCLLGASPAAAIIDPHTAAPDGCLRCHRLVPTAAESRSGDYRLLEETIDATCLRCHVKTECCDLGQRHVEKPLSIGVSHPSDLDLSKVPRSERPKTLPVHDDKITCNTCHLHQRQTPRDYKMVRLVVFRGSGIDWTPLCSDCHPKL